MLLFKRWFAYVVLIPVLVLMTAIVDRVLAVPKLWKEWKWNVGTHKQRRDEIKKFYRYAHDWTSDKQPKWIGRAQ